MWYGNRHILYILRCKFSFQCRVLLPTSVIEHSIREGCTVLFCIFQIPCWQVLFITTINGMQRLRSIPNADHISRVLVHDFEFHCFHTCILRWQRYITSIRIPERNARNELTHRHRHQMIDFVHRSIFRVESSYSLYLSVTVREEIIRFDLFVSSSSPSLSGYLITGVTESGTKLCCLQYSCNVIHLWS